MRLLLRCDAGPGTGVGHAVRCAAVAEAALAAGHEVAWSGRLDGLDWLWGGLHPTGTGGPPGVLRPPADDAAALTATAREIGAHAVHVDHYLLGADLRPDVNAAGIVLSTVEDFATGRRPGDVVVDPNLGSDAHPRPDDGSPVLLRGPAYAPLRAGTRAARAARDGATPDGAVPGDRRPGDPPRVLVVMGGTDAAGLLPAVVRALDATGAPADVDVVVPPGRDLPLPGTGGPVRFRTIAPLSDLPAAMAEADLVVSAAGTTVWELCCVGVPMALVRAADNQREGYRAVVGSGAGLGLGGAGDVADTASTADTLRPLLTDPSARAALAARARTIVDGWGAGRIVAAVAAAVEARAPRPAGELSARPATEADAALLLAWRNDPETRHRSRSSEEVAPADHRDWLRRSLERTDRLLLIVGDDRGPLGTVRWDREDAGWEVSITVAPDRRGAGLAGPLLAAGERALRERTGPGTPVTAVVHRDNAASARLFARAGYRPAGAPDADGFATHRRVLP